MNEIKVATIKDIGLSFTAKDLIAFEELQDVKKEIDKITDIINKYLSNFAKPPKCPGCGVGLSGIFGTFKFGLPSGEGFCTNCGYPCRAHHKFMVGKEPSFGSIFECILAYHPSKLKKGGD